MRARWRPGPDLSQLLPMDWTPERMGQKFVPRVIIWDEVCTVPCPLCKPSSTGSRDGASRTSAVAIRAAAPNHRRNATRLAPRACHLLRRGRSRPQSQKPSRSESAFSSTGSSAERCERRFLVALGGNASWRPGSHVISDLEAEGSRQGPEAAVRAP